MDEKGKQISQLSEPSVYGPTRISPDGSRIAMDVIGQAGLSPLWIWDLNGGDAYPDLRIQPIRGYSGVVGGWTNDLF